MSIISKSSSYALSLLLGMAVFNGHIDLTKINNLSTLTEAVTLSGQNAEAAQTQVNKYYAAGRSIKGLKRKGGPMIDWNEIFSIVKDILKDESVTIPENFKFVSPNSAKVEWNDASLACDQLKGKLRWYKDQKTCF